MKFFQQCLSVGEFFGRPICWAVFTIFFFSGAVNSGPFELDSHVDASFQPDYLENFLEPDSELLRNTTICPSAWHVKEMHAVLQLWNLEGEEHTITTEDGYIITLFRLTPLKANATPVLLLHGYLSAPELWLTRGKEDLPVVLRDAGFDVWLGTYRGTHYGRRHVNLTTEDKKFWNFSFHEHGLYDAPAIVDHILRDTGRTSLAAVGHSMGNAVMFVMLSLRPEYNEKVHMFVGLSPYAVARSDSRPLRRALLHRVQIFLRSNKPWTSSDVFRRRKINPTVGMCWSLPRLCYVWLNWLMGKIGPDFDWKLIPVLLAYFPSGSSNKNLEHLFRIDDEHFIWYDYGPEGNMKRYNSRVPPSYDLSHVRVPVSLYYGETDSVVHTAGMKAQIRALPNVVKSMVVPGYNHMYFLVARNTRTALYNPLIEDLKRYDPNRSSLKER